MVKINFVIKDGILSCENKEDIKKVTVNTSNYIMFKLNESQYQNYDKICVFENKDVGKESAVLLPNNVCILPRDISGLSYFSVHFVLVNKIIDQKIVTNKEYFLLGG